MWWIIAFEGATGNVTLIGRIYRGYIMDPRGSFIGFIWAFIDSLIAGALFAWLYNFIAARIASGANRYSWPEGTKIAQHISQFCCKDYPKKRG